MYFYFFLLDDLYFIVICIVGNILYNVLFVKDIEVGVFILLKEVGSVESCVCRVCNRWVGYVVFFLEKMCFMVCCYVLLILCRIKIIKFLIFSIFIIFIILYIWFGKLFKYFLFN